MADLYQEISRDLHEALVGEVEDVTLTKISYGARTDSTSARSETETDYTVKGWLAEYSQSEMDGSMVTRQDRKVCILSESLPAGVTPAKDDRVTASDGEEYNVVHVGRDTAGAIYVCQGRG